MANIKFSAFTQLAPIDQTNSYIVGYEGDANTNNRWTFGEVALGLKDVTATPYSIYSASGALEATREVTFSAHDLKFIATGNGKLWYQDGNQAAGYVLKSDANGEASWAAETDTNTNIANTDLTLNASRTLGLGANQNLTFTGSGTSKVTFSNTGGVQFDEDVTFVKNLIIQGQAYTELHTGAAIASINWDDGNVQEITLAVATVTFNPSNPKAGATYILKITQPGGGGPGAITWGSGVKWAGGSPPTLTSGSSAVDIVTLICTDATGQGVYYANATLNFS